MSLHWSDYFLLALFLAISMSIGLYHAYKGQSSIQAFIMANRRLAILPTMLSMLGSNVSAISIVGHTAEMYDYGIGGWYYNYISTVIAMVLIERLIVPLVYPLKLTSAFEYLYLRFNSRTCAIVASLLGIFSALCTHAVTGFPTSVTVPILAAVCTIYTSMGGMKAVIWTDVFQCLIMVSGVMAMIIEGNIHVGGFGKALDYCRQEGRIYGPSFSLDPLERHTFWTWLFDGISRIFTMGFRQNIVQRFSATKSMKNARLTMLFYMAALMCFSALSYILGRTVLGYFAWLKCDPRDNGDVGSGNEILSFYVTILFSHLNGFYGLYLATLLSGALSSVSSSLSGTSANLWQTVLKYWLTDLPDDKATILTRCLVVLLGALGIGSSFFVSTMSGPMSQIVATLNSAIGSSMYGMFALGAFFPFANWIGALAGVTAGLIMNMWIGIGAYSVPLPHSRLPGVSTEGCFPTANQTYITTSPFTESTPLVTEALTARPSGLNALYAVSYKWYAPIGTGTCIIVGIVVSLLVRALSKEKPDSVPARLLVSWGSALSWGENKRSEVREPNANVALFDLDSAKLKDAKVTTGTFIKLGEWENGVGNQALEAEETKL